ncbi:MAG: VTT domain-containing protein [Candidatus Nanoarchaeia archaeon]|nr:VTT domain-containing protein [Candidatus Nanoarchaeia archaeon]
MFEDMIGWWLGQITLWVSAFGYAGLLIAMVVQAIIVIIPSEGVLMLAGAVFGLFGAGIFGGIGELLGAVTGFYIAKKGGRPIAEKLVGKDNIKFADKWFERWGGWAVLAARLAPFIPFDAISYGAGLTKIKFSTFMKATTVGAFPRAFFFAWLGILAQQKIATEGFEGFFSATFGVIAGIILLMVVLNHYVVKKYVKKQDKTAVRELIDAANSEAIVPVPEESNKE